MEKPPLVAPTESDQKYRDAIVENERNNFRNLFKQTPEMVCILKGPEHIFDFVNEAHVRALGFDATGMSVRQAQPESTEVHGILDEVYRTGVTAQLIEIPVTVTNRLRYFNLTYAASRDHNGSISGIMILGVEITEQIESRRRIEESEERFRIAVEAANMGTWDLNVETGTVNWSKRTSELFGVSPGANFPLELAIARIHPDDRNKVTVAIAEAIDPNGSGNYEIEYRTIHEDGGTHWVALRGKAISKDTPTGRITTRFTGTVLDVTDRVISEQALKKREEELKAALSARNEFVSIASHELKTPLTSLKLQTQSMKRNFLKGRAEAFSLGKVRELIDNNEMQVGRLIRLVDDMLDFSKIEAGKLSISREQTDLCPLVAEVFNRLKDQLEADGIETSFACLAQSQVWIDRFRIEQVVTNLLTNAARYGEGKPVSVEVTQDRDMALIIVTDHGKGIALENRERIFNRFERVVSENEISGLGLGLYITKQIVESHQGRIWVESTLGQGSAFKVQLPLAASKAE